MNKNNYGWICPKCGRVYAPIIMECSHCNNNEIKPDPCIITPPWSQDYSKYKSEVTTEYFQELEKYPTDLERDTHNLKLDKEPMLFGNQIICDSQGCREVDLFGRPIKGVHKYSSLKTLQESLDGLNKELENHGVQPTSLNELEDIKKTLNQDSNDDMWPTEKEVKAHLKYIKEQTEKEQTESEKNIIDDDESYWKCTRCGKIHLVFPEGGCECGAPLEYLTYVI